MQKLSVEQYNKIYSKLPEELKALSSSSETSEKVMKIGQRYHLQVDQIGTLIDIVLDVIMGITASRNFIEEIKKELGLSVDDASSIGRDINDEIFMPIKDIMMRVYKDEAPNKPAPTLQVSHDEEDHSNVSKAEILKEIEEPSKPEIKKIKLKEEIPTISKSKEIEEFHEELSGKTILAPKIEPNVIFPSQAKNITETKIGSIVTPQKIEIIEKPKTSENKVPEQKNHSADPYREPPVA